MVANQFKNSNSALFLTFEITGLADEIEESYVFIINHLISLWKQFLFYFKELDMSNHKWIRNPFLVKNYYNFCLTIAKWEMMINLTNDSTLKQIVL